MQPGGHGFESRQLHSCSVFELGHVEDPVEGRPVLLIAELAAFHVEAFEDCGVEQFAGAIVGLAVGVAAAGGQRRGQFKDLLPLGDVGIEVGQAVLDGVDGRADPGLLGLEGGDVVGAAVVGVEQLAPFTPCLGQPVGEQVALGRVGCLALFDLGGHLPSQSLGPGLGELDAPVEVLGLGLKIVGGHVGLSAGAKGVVLLAQAEEVDVAALGVLDREAPAAHPAVE